jgi:PTH1 family peptidyl-tRNA hydrolase
MKKIIGLRNPKEKYKLTRHNVGEFILRKFQEKEGFPQFKNNKRMNALTSKGFIEEDFLMILPNTFMNSSGKVAKKIIEKPKNLWVIHDDIDIPLGEIKISQNRGSGGHNGIKSIINEIQSKDFVRFRIGIKPNHPVASENLPSFVLQKFNKKELEQLKEVSNKIIEIIKFALKEGINKTMSRFN